MLLDGQFQTCSVCFLLPTEHGPTEPCGVCSCAAFRVRLFVSLLPGFLWHYRPCSKCCSSALALCFGTSRCVPGQARRSLLAPRWAARRPAVWPVFPLPPESLEMTSVGPPFPGSLSLLFSGDPKSTEARSSSLGRGVCVGVCALSLHLRASQPTLHTFCLHVMVYIFFHCSWCTALALFGIKFFDDFF